MKENNELRNQLLQHFSNICKYLLCSVLSMFTKHDGFGRCFDHVVRWPAGCRPQGT